MYPTQNPIALRSKKLITETLLTLLKTYPFNEITVKQILIEAKISRKTFYRNFSSKEDVLSSYIDSILNDYKDVIFSLEKVSFADCFDVIFSFCEANRDLLIILKNNNLLHLPMMKLNELLPTLHMEIDIKNYIIFFNIGAIWNVIINWVENDMRDPSDSIKQILIDYLDHIDNDMMKYFNIK